MNDTILVTGASGKLGRAIIGHLLDRRSVAPSRLIAASRAPEKLADLAARGVTVRRIDFDDDASLERGFSDADTILIISTDALDGAGTRLRQHKAAVAAAARSGATRLAYTSLPNAETSHVGFAPDHLGTEEAIKATGLPHLIFRNGWYAENLLMSLPQALATRQWFTSAGDGRTSFIARDDIAAAIAAALASPPETSTTWTLTGPEALTNGEIAELAASVSGKPVAIVPLSDEQLAQGLKAAGLPDTVIPTLVSFDTATREGDLATVTDDATRLSGRALVPVRAFLEASKAAL